MSIFEFLGLDKKPPPASEADTQTVRKITAALDRLEPDRARYIAGFAYILSRVSHADLNIGPEEIRAMESLIVERGGLPEAQAVLVVQMAKTQSLLFGGTENFLVTRQFSKIASRDEKLALLDCLFAVSSADQSISVVEDNEIRQIASELRLEHADFIAARSRYRQHLSVLQKQKPGVRSQDTE